MKHNFRELNIWKKGIELTKEVYALTNEFKKEETYGLKSQMNRSAVSIPSNITEGSGRSTKKEFNHFLNIALSSSYELETQLILSKEIFGIEIEQTISKTNEIQKMIAGFQRTLKS